MKLLSFLTFAFVTLLSFPTYAYDKYPAECWQSEDGIWHIEIEIPKIKGRVGEQPIIDMDKHEFESTLMIHSGNCQCKWWLYDY